MCHKNVIKIIMSLYHRCDYNHKSVIKFHSLVIITLYLDPESWG